MSDMNGKNLPPGWVTSALSEVAQINPPLDRCVVNDDVQVAFIPMRAVEPEGGGVASPEARRYVEVKKGYTSFLSKDVIMAKITPCMENGKTAVVPDVAGQVCFGSTEFHAIRSEQGVEPKWIAQFLLQHEVRRSAQRQMTGGVGQMRVPASFLEAVRVPVAPSAEQVRIIDALDELFSDLDAGVAALERVRGKLKLYRASVLKAAVEGKLTTEWRAQHLHTEPANELLRRILIERRRRWEEAQLAKFKAKRRVPPKNWKAKYQEPNAPDTSLSPLPVGWCWASVDQLTEGHRACAYGVLQPGPHLPAGIPLVRVGDINAGKVDETRLKRISLAIASEYERTRLEGGELLITLVGTIGRTAVAPRSLRGANTARAVGVIPLTTLISSAWVELWFRNVDKQNEMTLKSHEVARKTLNLEDVRPSTVAVPTLAEQEAIVEAVEDQLSIIDHLDIGVEAKLKLAQSLRQSILRHAFAGKLVPQDPSNEPASELVKRIADERAAHCHKAAAVKRPAKRRTGNRAAKYERPRKALELA